MQICDAYKQRGFEFLLQAFCEPKFLEDFTGLTKLVVATESMSFDWDEDEDGLLNDCEITEFQVI